MFLVTGLFSPRLLILHIVLCKHVWRRGSLFLLCALIFQGQALRDDAGFLPGRCRVTPTELETLKVMRLVNHRFSDENGPIQTLRWTGGESAWC
jgi:hypothetical protein